jgi:hypothetical protein
MIAPAGNVDWDTVGCEVENDIIQVLAAATIIRAQKMSEVNVSMLAGSSEWSGHWRFPVFYSVGFQQLTKVL